ncbi:YlcI/YnfO family protein [Rhizorhabdus sp.]|nr:YlcI/YnfO family protein [Rhizorhabdus sp.]
MMARFPAGTLARIDKVLREGESKADFVRQAVEERLQSREAGDDK